MPTRCSNIPSLESLEARQLLANVVWDGGPDGLGTDMGLAINWVGDARPGPADTAIINTPGAALDLDRSQPLIALQSTRDINVRSGGTLTTTGTSSLSANLNLIGGAVNGGIWNFTGAAGINGSSSSGTLANVTTNAPILLDTTSESLRIAGTINAPVIRLLAQSTMTLVDGANLASNVEIGGTSGGTRSISIEATAQAAIASTATIRHINASLFQLTINIASGSVLTNLGAIEVSTALVTITGGSFVNQGTLRVFGLAECRMQAAWINQGTVLVTGGTLNMSGAFDARAGIGSFRVMTPGVVLAGNAIDNAGNILVFNDTTGSWTFAGATLSGGSLDFQQAATMNFSSNGGITLQNVVALQAASVSANQHFRVGGTTTIPSIRMLGNSVLYFLPGYELQFPVVVGSATTGSYNVTFETNGSARASIGTNGSLRVLPIAAGGLSIGTDTQGTPLINLGQIISEAATTLWIGSINNFGLISVSAGSFRLGQFSILTSTGTIRTTGGDIRIDGTWDMTSGTGIIDAYHGSITLYGTMNLGGSTLTLDGVTGPLTMQPGAVIANGTVVTAVADRFILIPSTSPNNGPFTTFNNLALNGTVTLPTNVWLNLTGTTQTFQPARYQLTGGNTTLLLASAGQFAGTAIASGPATGERRIRAYNPSVSPVTFGGTAVVELDATSGGQFTIGYPLSGTVINQGVVRNRSTAQILNVENIFINQNLVSMNVNGTIQFRQLSNTGTLSATTGRFLIDTFDNTLPTMGTLALTGATVQITQAIQNTASVFTLNASSGAWIMQSVSQVVGGSVVFTQNNQLTHESPSGPVTYRDVSFPSGLTIMSQAVRFLNTTTAAAINLQGTGKLYIQPNRVLNYPIVASGSAPGIRTLIVDGSTSLADGLRIPDTNLIEMLPDCGGDLLIQGHVTNLGALRNRSGAGTLYISCTAFDNQGLVEAASGTVTLSANFQQRGILRTLAGATLLVNDLTLFPGVGTIDTLAGNIRIIGTINNVGNTLVVNESITRWIFANGTLSQGVVDVTAFPLSFSTSRSTLDRVAVVGDLLIRASSSVAITLGTTITGSIRLTAGGATIAFASGYALATEIRGEGAGTGIRTIQLAYNSAGSFTITPQGSIRLAAGSGDDLFIQGNSTAQLINQGAISNESTTRSFQITAGTISMPGLLRSSGGALLFPNVNSPVFSGTIFLGAGSLLQISATGGLTLPAAANIIIELGSVPGPQTGAIRVSGHAAVLGGTLTVQKAPGADLPLFTSYSLVTAIAGTVQGSFASITLPAFDTDEKGFITQGSYFLTYTNTTLADFNNDLTVDLFDYLDFVNSFASGSPSADVNGDGVLDFFDYLDFVVVFSRF